MARQTKPASFYKELHKRAHLVHGLSKDDQALELARMLIRLLPTLESLVQHASHSGRGVHDQTRAIDGFVSVACSLAVTLDRPIR